MTWNDYSNDEVSFEVDRSPDGRAFTRFATAAANSTSHTDGGLRANTLYTYRVRAFHARAASIHSNTASARTLRR